MFYAIFSFQGHQFFIQENLILKGLKSSKTISEFIIIHKVLILTFLGCTYIGQPFLQKSPLQIIGRKLDSITSRKLLIFKLKSKKKYRRKNGFREISKNFLITVIPNSVVDEKYLKVKQGNLFFHR